MPLSLAVSGRLSVLWTAVARARHRRLSRRAGLRLLRLDPALLALQQLLRLQLGANERVAGLADGADQLVELELGCLRVSVLGVLDQKDHEECDQRRECVRDQLP